MKYKEVPMSKLEALRFISNHYGVDGMESNTFGDILHDNSTDHKEYTICEIQRMLEREGEKQ